MIKYNDFFVFLSMNFWKKSGYGYADIAGIPLENLLLLIPAMSREDIIDWLSWNDGNGIYCDEQSLKELGNIMTRDEGIEVMIRQIEEGRAIA
jgi:hypothetical protein